MVQIQAIILDFDGTLVTGTNEGYFQCYHKAALESGFDISYNLTRIRALEQWGKTPRMELESIMRERLDLVNTALEIYQNLIETDFFLANITAIPGVANVLNKLIADGIEIAVISGMRKDLLNLLVKKFEFNFSEKMLISTIDSDDPLKQKTTGYHLRELIREKGWDKTRVLVVGDALSDVLMARSQEIEPVIVLSGIMSREEAENLSMKIILPSVSEIYKILDKN